MKENIFQLIKQDYLRLYEIFTLVNILKSILNPSFHASVWIRIVTSSPKFLYPLLRIFLISFFSIDCGRNATVGGGLHLPHPMNIVIGDGVVVGKYCSIYQGVTLGSKDNNYPRIGDNVKIYSNSVIVGDANIGDGVTVGANSFLCKNVESGEVYYRK